MNDEEEHASRDFEQPLCARCKELLPQCGPYNIEVNEYIDRVAREIHERVEHQRIILKHILGSGKDGGIFLAYCSLIDCQRLKRLREVLFETIVALEETKSSFKSRKLEVMRKKLTKILSNG